MAAVTSKSVTAAILYFHLPVFQAFFQSLYNPLRLALNPANLRDKSRFTNYP